MIQILLLWLSHVPVMKLVAKLTIQAATRNGNANVLTTVTSFLLFVYALGEHHNDHQGEEEGQRNAGLK